ncbi:MAG: Gfo/Idh/MocA family oxidoreductase, partial [Acetobacteraceae bacterium]|nr:Gfo/Idh/MocA family oxidoreductase [Acetobacteraceae bacterium]
MDDALRVLVVGLGHMGLTHARAYERLDGFELAGLCARSVATHPNLPERWHGLPRFADYGEALASVRPDVVSINTWPDTHADFAVRAFAAGAHVFVEKPLAETVADAERAVAAARAARRKMIVGYSARQSPTWIKLVEIARGLGKPLVMRMNLNQQSIGPAWTWHRNLLKALSPIVDCGVHYVDLMCLMTGAKPVRVHAIGVRLSDEIAPEMYNYGQLQVVFDDGSVGWYEAGWGPMLSETAFFLKDVIGPKGCVSILTPDQGRLYPAGARSTVSSDIETHAKAGALRVHRAALGPDDEMLAGDED